MLQSCYFNHAVKLNHLSSKDSLPVRAAKLLQSCLSLCDPMDSSLPGFSVQEILQARILEWVATPSSSGSSGPRDWIYTSSISYIGRLGSLPLAPPGKPTQSLYRFLLFLFISLFSKVTVLQISLGVGGSHLSLIVGSPGGAINQGTSLAPNEVWTVDLSRHEPGLWILIEFKKNNVGHSHPSATAHAMSMECFSQGCSERAHTLSLECVYL